MNARPGEAEVAGIGLATPAGRDPQAVWARLLEATSPTEMYTHPELPSGADIPVAIARCVSSAWDEPRTKHLDRSHHLAAVAADDALAMVAERPPPARCAVVCGIGYGSAGVSEVWHRSVAQHGMRGLGPLLASTMMPSSVAANLALRYGFEGPCLTVSTACSSGADAIGHGLDLLRLGRADLVLAGGVDAMLVLSPILAMYRTGAMSRQADVAQACRPFDRDRDGMVMGEGAGFMVLTRPGSCAAQGITPWGRVIGHASSCDAYHLLAPRPDGAVSARCVRAALEDAGATPSEVTHINAHGTATKANDAAESRIIHEVFGPKAPPVIAIKGATGHLIGASGAVEAIASLLALQAGVLPPVAGLTHRDPELDLDLVAGHPRAVEPGGIAVSQSFGFGGHNAALVLAGA